MTFKSTVHHSVQKSLEEFINESRSANPFGEVPWTSVMWPVQKKGRASDGRHEERIWFNANFVAKTTISNAESFVEPFGSFVKAVMCRREIRNIKGLPTIDHMVMVRALRYLYASIRLRSHDPIDLLPMDFDLAINSCKLKEKRSSVYRIGGKLAELAKMLDTFRLTKVRIEWKNTTTRDAEDGGMHHSRLGKKFEARRAQKLPKNDVLDAAARISNRTDLTDKDLLCQRAIELLLCCGFRPCELLTLRRDCWIEEPQFSPDGQPLVDRNGNPAVRYALRYIPGKNAHKDSQKKWLPTVMADVARRAVTDILRITEPFCNIASFIIKNRHRTLLPKPWHLLPDDYTFTMAELEEAVGLTRNNGKAGRQFAKSYCSNMFTNDINGREVTLVAKGDLERALVSRCGVSTVFNSGQARYSLDQCLFVVGVNYFHSTKNTLNGTAILATQGQLSDYMVGRPGVPSIFERLNICDDDGKPFKVIAYQFRHWLNTLGIEGGLGETELARWMGRTQIGQNSTYNQMTGRQLAESVRQHLQKNDPIGPLPELANRINDPVRREEFLLSMVGTGHVTDLGICIHDWSALPCPKHGKCDFFCEEHLIEKGNPEQKGRANEAKENTEALLKMVETEMQDGTYGVDNWKIAHEKTLIRLTQIVATHNDPSIPFGTLVHLGKQNIIYDDSEE
ncbi:hypothetical protein RCH09_001102 [Actimicrobium sp. GrIS 1.19]|uniref:hypothetical protein n=1 Tax=Actimicrobium sp. GrIS 1.19 TaxID=3071708 RepID=UPI002E0987B6|nr:hypothetical protein [Actimicrobium sp. GrIS 1.19]